MAQETMVKEDLSESMVRAGERLTKKLLDSGMVVNASFWLYMPEANAWRLFIATSEVSKSGPKRVYGEVQQALSQAPEIQPDLGLEDISVVDPKNDMVRLLRAFLKTGDGVIGRRVRGNTVNGHYIDDAFIYRSV
jgi:hypothetical protein